jgi:hypothetical protein
VQFKSGTHRLEFVPGTRAVSRGVIDLVDEFDRPWRQEIELAFPPWLSSTIGYNGGSWKDGGSLFTYHGPGLNLEWDEFDLSKQPFELYNYNGQRLPSNGLQAVMRLRSTGPDGTDTGQAYLEFFLNGRYKPYDFT